MVCPITIFNSNVEPQHLILQLEFDFLIFIFSNLFRTFFFLEYNRQSRCRTALGTGARRSGGTSRDVCRRSKRCTGRGAVSSTPSITDTDAWCWICAQYLVLLPPPFLLTLLKLTTRQRRFGSFAPSPLLMFFKKLVRVHSLISIFLFIYPLLPLLPSITFYYLYYLYYLLLLSITSITSITHTDLKWCDPSGWVVSCPLSFSFLLIPL